MTELHSSPEDAMQVYKWYREAQCNYSLLFLQLYISYNAWYREVTGTSNDRQAIAALKKRFVIWDDYANGKVMQELSLYMKRLAEITQQTPMASSHQFWSGEVESVNDWQSLIEFWYQVRCLIVHGAEIRQKYAWLAYETLNIFMGEIIDRMRNCFNSKDEKMLGEIISDNNQELQMSPGLKHLQKKLYQKYIASPNIWQVDMQRVKGT